MTDAFETFKQAAQNNDYAEYNLNNTYTLITDVEGDGVFTPYVIGPDFDNPRDHIQDVDDLLMNYLSFEVVEYDEGNSERMNASVYHVDGAQIPK